MVMHGHEHCLEPQAQTRYCLVAPCCRVYAPKPPAAGKRRVDVSTVSCLSMVKDFYPQKILSHRSLPDTIGGPQAQLCAALLGDQSYHSTIVMLPMHVLIKIVPNLTEPTSNCFIAGNDTADVRTKPVKQPLFQDENLGSFFRRLAWSPDGNHALRNNATPPPCNMHYAVTVLSLSQPALD